MVIMYGKINTYGQRGCQHGEALDSITAMHKYEKVGRPHNLCERIYDLTNKLSSGGDRRCTRQQMLYGAKLRTRTCVSQCFTMFLVIFSLFHIVSHCSSLKLNNCGPEVDVKL